MICGLPPAWSSSFFFEKCYVILLWECLRLSISWDIVSGLCISNLMSSCFSKSEAEKANWDVKDML